MVAINFPLTDHRFKLNSYTTIPAKKHEMFKPSYGPAVPRIVDPRDLRIDSGIYSLTDAEKDQAESFYRLSLGGGLAFFNMYLPLRDQVEIVRLYPPESYVITQVDFSWELAMTVEVYEQ